MAARPGQSKRCKSAKSLPAARRCSDRSIEYSSEAGLAACKTLASKLRTRMQPFEYRPVRY